LFIKRGYQKVDSYEDEEESMGQEKKGNSGMIEDMYYEYIKVKLRNISRIYENVIPLKMEVKLHNERLVSKLFLLNPLL
jgi:hypothetical protein